MTRKRSESVDYASECTVCVEYEDGGTDRRLVYERPQMQLPHRRLTRVDLMKIARYPTDQALAEEARAIFSDMQEKGQIGKHAALGRIFIARTAFAALEMDL